MALIHGQDAIQNQYPVRVDDQGHIIPSALDTGSNYRPLRVDTQGRPIIAGLVSGSTYVPLLLDASGRVTLAVQDAGATKRPVLCDGSGRVYMAIKGDDKIFSMEDQYTEAVSNTNLAAGTNLLNSTTVPAGKVYVITNISIRYDGTVAGVALSVYSYKGATFANVFSINTVVSIQYYDRQVNIPLVAGGFIRLIVTGATAGNDAYLDVTGYIMDGA